MTRAPGRKGRQSADDGPGADGGMAPADGGDDAFSGFARITFWQANLVAFAFYVMFSFMARAVFYQNVGHAMILTAVLDPLVFAYTILLRWIYLRELAPGVKLTRAVLLVITLSIAAGLVLTGCVNLLRAYVITTGRFHAGFGGPFVQLFFFTTVLASWSVACFWLMAHSEMRAERLRRMEAESAVLKAELHQLQMQLDPHFLFNALNTLAAQIPDNPETALEMNRLIAAYLRRGLDRRSEVLSPLAAELEQARAYIRIQALRFEDRLAFTLDVDEASLDVMVPPLVLQGLVENAVKHGLTSSTGPLHVRVRVAGDADRLSIEVTNEGEYAPRPGPGRGLGLDNTRRRLAIHYPGRHSLSIAQEGGMVVARITLDGAPAFG
jgi:sensor histidine kinase YesM